MDDPAEQGGSLREHELAAENARLKKICAALIERVESSGVAGGAPYAAFEHAVLLAEQVRERTEALHRTLEELSQVNARLRDEIAVRVATERRLREAKAEAEDANLSKTKFLAAVSHDLLQPLNAARLFTSALIEQEMPDSPRTLAGHIGRSLKDVEALLGTLVDISRLDAGVLKPDIAPFEVSELLDVLAQEYRQIAASRELELHYVASSVVVESDLALLARVIRNFLTNAIRYTEQGRVLLGCRRRPEGLEILVGDTGTGIADDQRDTIFQEFKRADAQSAFQDRGLGLGLAIVDRIAAMLEYPVRLTSRLGHGSAFSILVPYGKLSPAPGRLAMAEPVPAMAGPVGKRIWVIDNDPAICQGMAALLGGWGCRVITASSQAMLERTVVAGAEAAGADALIVDYHLDETEPDGLAVAANLRRRWPALPVIVITANHDATLRQRARELGYGCLLKPLKPLRLKMELMRLCEE
ncbi:Signal transduction histidine kinase [Modicisalibacter ilicicola DSM 19980]|uniref:histidine kinase n=1 Tax=Modicisalibacter ilicicola DSM 19980 TaxID=1121942 RepID=A0A1M5A1U6_9GAMM|nr:hybrid sensor histidine kinase/response regulator [Halomonas ilicicola]SHF23906.1 Signal transduction histidine kinase [Halomonas ilicicola DSM 19980]